ncbi:MAG: L-ribulose-5-phosphate 3-epimerase [Lachnospiraceae bacterium]|nr:L-ribulose-5-phosphate 3-epimerase [Lachnospiraceae bacterium]MDY5742089.1 L-ribulose-5-phosphate 3-epimerase [Lachnospiraceae bacterium]
MKQYELGLYEKAMPAQLTWREKLTAAKAAGYDFLEISIDETDTKLERLAWTEMEREALREVIKEVGLPIRTMCLSGHRKYPLGSHDQAIRDRGLEIMQKAIELAQDIGVKIIQLAGYDVYYEEGDEFTRRCFAENLLRSTMLAAKAGILLGFETMETPFMNTTAKAMEHVNRVGSAYLGVYPDLGNITNAVGADVERVRADLESGRGHLMAMHLKETIPGRFREIPYGTGHVDFAAGIETAWRLGVRRYVTEFWFVGREDWQTELRESRERMAGLLDRQEEKE